MDDMKPAPKETKRITKSERVTDPFTKAVLDALKEKGWTKVDLAAKLNCTRQAVQYRLHQRPNAPWGARLMQQYSRALGLKLSISLKVPS